MKSSHSAQRLKATGPSASNCAEAQGSPADAVHRQCCAAGDHPDQLGDQACRDSAVSETICVQIVDAPDEPFPPLQEEIDETIKLFPVERIPERNGDHIVDVPVLQTSEEVAEVVKANETPMKYISEEMIDAASHSFRIDSVKKRHEFLIKAYFPVKLRA